MVTQENTPIKGYQVDLATGEGLDVVFKKKNYDVIINCAAMSQPVACERDPEQADKINVPRVLLGLLQEHRASTGRQPLLVHISSDMVYGSVPPDIPQQPTSTDPTTGADPSGGEPPEHVSSTPTPTMTTTTTPTPTPTPMTQPPSPPRSPPPSPSPPSATMGRWHEEHVPVPECVYGACKLVGEQAVMDQWPNHVILRSSIIYGPETPDATPRPLFVQFIEKVLRKGDSIEFCTDEYRSPIHVEDLCHIVSMAVTRAGMANHTPLVSEEGGGDVPLGFRRLINAGGPERLSRLEMAQIVASVLRLDPGCLVPCTQAALEQVRGYHSPADIGMDVTVLLTDLKIKPMTFSQGVMKTFGVVDEEETGQKPGGGGGGAEQPVGVTTRT